MCILNASLYYVIDLNTLTSQEYLSPVVKPCTTCMYVVRARHKRTGDWGHLVLLREKWGDWIFSATNVFKITPRKYSEVSLAISHLLYTQVIDRCILTIRVKV